MTEDTIEDVKNHMRERERERERDAKMHNDNDNDNVNYADTQRAQPCNEHPLSMTLIFEPFGPPKHTQ